MPTFRDKTTGATISYNRPEITYNVLITKGRKYAQGTLFRDIGVGAWNICGDDKPVNPIDEIVTDKDTLEKIGCVSDYFRKLVLAHIREHE